MNQETSKKGKGEGPSETVYMAAAPAIAYGLAFAYEAGRAIYFDIPIWFISVGVASIFLSLILLVLATVLLINIVGLIHKCVPTNIFLFSIPLLSLIALTLLSGLCFGFTKATIPFIAGAVVSTITTYLWPAIKAVLKKKPYRRELDQFISDTDKRIPLLSLLERLHPGLTISLVVYVSFLLPLAYGIGRTAASLEDSFLVFGHDPEKVVVAIYGDFLISAPLLCASHQVVPTFTVRKIGDDADLDLRMEKIGPLISTTNAP